jgi:hypothetical protein
MGPNFALQTDAERAHLILVARLVGTGLCTLVTEAETMIRTVEAVIGEHGNVGLFKPVHLQAPWRALVTI